MLLLTASTVAAEPSTPTCVRHRPSGAHAGGPVQSRGERSIPMHDVFEIRAPCSATSRAFRELLGRAGKFRIDGRNFVDEFENLRGDDRSFVLRNQILARLDKNPVAERKTPRIQEFAVLDPHERGTRNEATAALLHYDPACCIAAPLRFLTGQPRSDQSGPPNSPRAHGSPAGAP